MKQINRRSLLGFGLFGCASLLAGCSGLTDDVSVPNTGAPANPPAPTPSPAPTPAPNPTPSPAPSPTPTPAPTPAPNPAPPPGPPAWSVNPSPIFVVGANTTFDLSLTLPAGVARGGRFGVSPAGAQLPAGVTLSPEGILSISSTSPGRTDGVIFTYAEPS